MRSISVQVLGLLASVAVAATPHSVGWDGHSGSGANYVRGGSGSGSGQTSQGSAADDGQQADGAARPTSSFDVSYNAFHDGDRHDGDRHDGADEQGGDRSGYAGGDVSSSDPSGMAETMGRSGSGGGGSFGASGGQGWGGQGGGGMSGGAPGASGSGGVGSGGSKSSGQGGATDKPTVLAFDDQPQDKTDPMQTSDDPPKKILQSARPGLSVAAVPEPAAWMMMIGGMMAMGAALRSRRRATAGFGA